MTNEQSATLLRLNKQARMYSGSRPKADARTGILGTESCHLSGY